VLPPLECPTVTAPVMPGAEPFTAEGGPHGFLAIHGFTGTPSSMRPLAERFAEGGWAVECPLLPGHGTAVQDMVPTRWDDWSAAAEQAYQRLAGRVDGRIVVGGLSMGGTLTVWLAAGHPDVAGIVCINPLVAGAGQLKDIVQAGVDQGQETMPGISSDIAAPGVTELAYTETPMRPLLSLFDAIDDLQPALGSISVPLLLLSSPQDHVVPPFNADHLAEAVAGPVERVTLERSYHVATLDLDKDIVEERALDFAAKAVAG
jgi:carboxylesterase